MEGKVSWALTLFFLSVCACLGVNTSFQSTAPNNRDSNDEGEHYEARRHQIPAAPSSPFQLHLHTYLSEHRATPKCYHFILITLTSHPAFPAWLLVFVLCSCHCSCHTCLTRAHCTPLPAPNPPLHQQPRRRCSPAATRTAPIDAGNHRVSWARKTERK